MITITQPKVQGFWPRWAPFGGFSLLFDNPGRSLAPFEKGLSKLDCQPETEPQQDFYRRLTVGLDKIGVDGLINSYLFCPLAPYSYHTTVWDGLNDGNAAAVGAAQQRPLRDYLGQLPHSFTTESIFTEDIAASPLITAKWEIQFKLDHVAKWGNVGLVAVLATADDTSAVCLAELKQARHELYSLFEERFGLTLQSDYTPHVSLGYFANHEQAELASPHVNSWHDIIEQEVADSTITYHSISPYGFTDMITFFKTKGSSDDVSN